MRLVVISLVLSVVAAGCGSEPEPAEPGGESLVVYQRAGGIAGSNERLRVEPDGAATITVGYEGESRTFELSTEELRELEARIAAADLDAVEPPPAEPVCADCFSYEIVAAGERATFDDLAETPASVDELRAHLSEIAADHYPAGSSQIQSNS